MAAAAMGSSFQALPNELLIEVLTSLQEQELLNLRKSSRFFHDFILVNASRIANAIIIKAYAIEAKLFNPVLTDGWLTPTHPIILSEEIHIARYILERMSGLDLAATSFLHTRPLLVTRLSSPGPTFLKFLRSPKCSNLWVEASMRDTSDGGGVNEATSAKRLGLYYVRPFLDLANTQGIYIQRGFRSRKNSFLTPITD